MLEVSVHVNVAHSSLVCSLLSCIRVHVCAQVDARINQMLTFTVQSENVIRSSHHFDLESSVAVMHIQMEIEMTATKQE